MSSSLINSESIFTTTSSTANNDKLNINNILENKYIKAILYIILILYASAVAPKLPDWITDYFEYSIFKMFVVFLIGLLFIQDPIAAMIVTIGITITYLIIAEKKVNNYIKDVMTLNEDDENENENEDKYKNKKLCKLKEKFDPIIYNEKKINYIDINEKNIIINDNDNEQYFNNYINHSEEHFNNYINHSEEHFTN
jgi:hypothetical protein